MLYRSPVVSPAMPRHATTVQPSLKRFQNLAHVIHKYFRTGQDATHKYKDVDAKSGGNFFNGILK